jgi:hypothetical protein
MKELPSMLGLLLWDLIWLLGFVSGWINLGLRIKLLASSGFARIQFYIYNIHFTAPWSLEVVGF